MENVLVANGTAEKTLVLRNRAVPLLSRRVVEVTLIGWPSSEPFRM